LKNINL